MTPYCTQRRSFAVLTLSPDAPYDTTSMLSPYRAIIGPPLSALQPFLTNRYAGFLTSIVWMMTVAFSISLRHHRYHEHSHACTTRTLYRPMSMIQSRAVCMDVVRVRPTTMGATHVVDADDRALGLLTPSITNGRPTRFRNTPVTTSIVPDATSHRSTLEAPWQNLYDREARIRRILAPPRHYRWLWWTEDSDVGECYRRTPWT